MAIPVRSSRVDASRDVTSEVMGGHRCFPGTRRAADSRQAILSHSEPAAIRKDQGDERRPGPGSRKTRRGTHEAVAIIPEHGNHLVRIFDQACTLRVMTGQAFDCLEPAIPARAR